MRQDLFRDKKGVHVKLTKDTHAEFRKALFDRNLTMQAAFEEFASLVSQGDKAAVKLLDNLALKVIKKEITKYRRTDKLPVDELDHDALYHLIGEEEDEQETHIDRDPQG